MFQLDLSTYQKADQIFQTFHLRNTKRNFYALLLYKKFYITLDIIVMHIKYIYIYIYIDRKSCIILRSYTSCHIKEKCLLFSFFPFFPL